VAQFIAGFLEYKNGNTFGMVALYLSFAEVMNATFGRAVVFVGRPLVGESAPPAAQVVKPIAG